MSDLIKQDLQESEVQELRRTLGELLVEGDSEKIEAFIDRVENEKGFRFEAESMRRLVETQE